MISQTTANQLVESLSRLRNALNELALLVSDFQFEHDAKLREQAAQHTHSLLSTIRRENP